ncbi:hypothetical protein [Lysinibacillus xylanilyticus]|uniref:hypothetical protein n=1 Tax=Lysinibacillus xylanilyticus TaxID=582475 RepID=UPI003CFC2213
MIGSKLKKITLFISLLAVLLIISGCLAEMRGQKITVQKRVGEDEIYEDYKEVTQKKQVQKAMDIVKNANWETTKKDMMRSADFQFQFPFKNSSEGKIASYSLWLSPDDEYLEIVTDSDKYVKLTKPDSEKLYEILIEEKLN